MAIGFVIMTILAVIRYDYGNDYMNYYRSYLFIISHDFSFSIEKLTDIFREPGWTFINFLFKPFGIWFLYNGGNLSHFSELGLLQVH